ncbi:HlyD family efflux transporter periplasmic adaptor subunit [Acinetobacter portensis]|uniref:HlyD family efflux transporter periplasmic adaptor subunit n=3 Tax=Acinetobacter TaxID=469 RepID=A0AB35V1R2_9GAMM|nr:MULTISPECIES: HlyD family efflux transporter periplasmic adaptor subunit [Acinetobacter]MCK7608687.1 HlyD family efflux transporter periplasmic adaptor subunit [Acinetobacter portensis]MCK7639547.1 HlyD family efflux transporter periplasmic adaptor subunit [Acinetobacter portensis]MDY6458316.1 HlyD family efflux transporter periplasmic adaptor subunit [Acinetobacter faecalis]MDY6461241.1 HlyD family efflux transporter periplasmic adaptor subunit [Acinetobacter faecalis]MDY6487671.1 HlyD fam
MTDAQATLPETPNSNEATDQQLKAKRKKALSLVALLFAIVLVLFLIWKFVFNNTVTTDNAYVGAETASITSMVTGQVAEVFTSDTKQVKKGDLLVQIDPRDAEITVAQAQAELLKAQRQFKQTQANSSSLSSQIYVSSDAIQSATAQVAKAKADLAKAQDDYNRRVQLSSSGAISKEELSTSKASVNTAKAVLDVAQAGLAQAKSSQKAAQSNLEANEALIRGANEQSTPDVLVAQAKLKQALLDLERTQIKAPLDGVVTRRNIQVGQRVSPGTSLMMIVPENQLYVDANFKESQLEKVRAGQKVTLTSDLYGDSVEYTGTIVGFSGGTGAAFALIPAQNATGNWIKVVQRLPVRIQLDPKELEKHPLRVGLSMEAKVDLKSK